MSTPSGPAHASSGARPLRAWLIYTGLRLVVFIGTAGFFAIFGVNGLPLLLLSVLVSGVVSLFVLRPQRDALVVAQQRRRESRDAARSAARAQLDEP